ncbi:DoxX family protein [Photobacterium japonica]|uniref:DoxX family protein n=1 Tax=Photobacterium japonica TaxID=2910235 RepID=UPI003D0D40FF
MTTLTISLLIAFFVFASSIKLLGWQRFIFDTQLAFFHKYGLNRSFMFLVGLVELTGALLLASYLLSPVHHLLLWAGAGLLGMTSFGALFFHFRFDGWKDAVPAMITLALSLIAIM